MKHIYIYINTRIAWLCFVVVLNRSTVVISFRFASPALVLLCLKGKCRFDEIFIVGCTGSCHLAPSSASSDGNVMPQCKWHNPHDDYIKWKHFPRNWQFVREIHRSPVNFPPVTRSFDVFFDLRLNERLSKQP